MNACGPLRQVGALLMIDGAPGELIAAGLLKNPVKYAHIVTSYHKTLAVRVAASF